MTIPAPRTEVDTWPLVTAAQAGDRAAFGQLYELYVDGVYRYVLSRVWGDRTLAEDLTAEVFYRALHRIGSVQDQGKDVGAWFTTIARNLVLDHVKSSRHKLEVRVGCAVGETVNNRTPESECLDWDLVVRVRSCVARLSSADQRECLELRFLAGLSVAETAGVMGRTEVAVRVLQYRAVRALALMPELAGLR
jgi:RNA polymerase sigma-70 factor, ECF subfamily